MMGFNGSIPMFGGLGIRMARQSDDGFLLEMFMAARPWLAMASSDPDYVRFLYEDQRRIARLGDGSMYPDHLEFVVERTGQDVGHLVIELGQANWHITQLEIHPRARDKGIGSDLVRSLQAAAGNARVALTLRTPMSLARSIAFYRRLGFQVAATYPAVLELAWTPPGVTWPPAASTHRFN